MWPSRSVAMTVAMADAPMLTTLLPIKMVINMRAGLVLR